MKPIPVLLVDDDPLLIEVYTAILESMDLEVTPAENGEAALALIPTLRPALIVTDVMMPRMTGLELCQRLRADASTRDLPIIIHSGSQDVTVPPGEVFLSKTCELAEFMGQVSRSLAASTSEAPHASAA